MEQMVGLVLIIDLLKKNTNIEFFKGTSRVDNIENVTSERETIKPSHIVSFIGRTHGSIEKKCILQ